MDLKKNKPSPLKVNLVTETSELESRKTQKEPELK